MAKQAGIDEFHAELLPEDKVTKVEKLVNKYKNVAMIGDGINDAPALARSNLGIAMGAIGNDIAIETADIALMSDDIGKLPWLIKHSKRTLDIIKQNVTFAIAVKAIFISLAMANLTTLWMAIAADIGTTLIVIINALRLLK
nr:HAD-IC family P-type ATPase [Francisella halioticida]